MTIPINFSKRFILYKQKLIDNLSEEIKINTNLTKEERYIQLLPQIKALIEDETDTIANLANICAVLKYSMTGFFWVGFYTIKGNELVLGPYQGPVACTRIQLTKGVCGAAVSRKETIIVPDVDKFSGHIACSSLSNSEIVIPLFNGNDVVGVLDVDSDSLNMFDETDKKYLEELCGMIKL